MTAPEPAGRLRICLAASGGGHVRQLLDLEPAWGAYDHFFVSEDTALSRSIGEKHRTHFVPHLALGQARLGSPISMLRAAVRSLFGSYRIIARERPHILVTTGAGAVFFTTVWARLFGCEIVLVESLARFNAPSLFGRMASAVAHHRIAQSSAIARYWPDAEVFDPIRLLEAPRPDKKPLLFATVGAVLPFDRLVSMVAELKQRGHIPEDVVIQTGLGGLAPDGIEVVQTLPFDRMQELLRDADLVICHGGSGSLITALRHGCRIVAVPRLFELGEVYDDHQKEITEAFAARGLISTADTVEELAEALRAARAKPPVMATSDPQALTGYLRDMFEERARRRQARA